MLRRLFGKTWRPDPDKGMPGPEQLKKHLAALERQRLQELSKVGPARVMDARRMTLRRVVLLPCR